MAFGLLNVWIVRFGKNTSFRGGGAKDLRGEFRSYGLPGWTMWLTGALAMLAGIWLSALVRPATIVLIVLMLAAFVMHLKLRDPFIRALPSHPMLAMAVAVAFLIRRPARIPVTRPPEDDLG